MAGTRLTKCLLPGVRSRATAREAGPGLLQMDRASGRISGAGKSVCAAHVIRHLQSDIRRHQYWIIDALDECFAVEHRFFKQLANLECAFDLRIFVTSRSTPKLEGHFKYLKQKVDVVTDSIQYVDTQADMRLYLDSHLDDLPVDDPAERSVLVDKMLTKADDCFLWLSLVYQELEGVYSKKSIARVLDDIPQGMSELYERSFRTICQNKKESELTQTLFMWSLCSTRPLKLPELRDALGRYGDQDVGNLRRTVEDLCGGLLLVDKNDGIQLVHSTTREFLLGALGSEFGFKRVEGHEMIALVCLKCMGREMIPPTRRLLKGSEVERRKARTAFSSYASVAFSEHIAASSSISNKLLKPISDFLSKNVSAWIEHVALEQPSLYWIRLVAKFGRNLQSTPRSIFNLIPSIAPKQSRLFQQTTGQPRWVELVGPAAASWDDCISIIEFRDTYGLSLACSGSAFAIGMRNGLIKVYDRSTCQERFSVRHRIHDGASISVVGPKKGQATPVRLLAFDSSETRFASASHQSVCLWSMNAELLTTFRISEFLVTLTFSIDQRELIGVSRSSRVVRWKVYEEDNMLSVAGCHARHPATGNTVHHNSALLTKYPIAATISPDQSLLALLYRGEPIYLCSLEDNTVVGQCGRDVGSKFPNISVQTALFNPNPDLRLLAIAYQDGELSVYDAWAHKELISVDGDAYLLASTPDGRTLGSGNTRGSISLWDFETLSLLYHIRSGIDEVRTLAFTGDGLRVVDIRDNKTKVWEPIALVRRSVDEDAGVSDASALEGPVVGYNEETVSITAVCSDDVGDFVFAGRSDGSVVVYNVRTGLFHTELYVHSGNLLITAITFRRGVIATADIGCCVIVRTLLENNKGGKPSASPENVRARSTASFEPQRISSPHSNCDH
ncbi:uncharacterized protein Z518_03395 [Rhinocladiella mackenziei CBS 650.93]|uniref:GPI inositol-deacylase winged helix domain-containing protein n=1 Tax=Rhinocladiella mackenziei CBS 650.93 TaxID=1442369 RepID=A0A0D2HDV1_9EURO|nr:uncharacterized protein Z518_03395 [Rhinocladiella mackenziei CBS 650.93]KIX08738.1 hypothetical protein Z518_03395 [Rhinocladiella mackenziei CBS 650.93]